MNRRPNCFQATANRGMFITMIITPTGKPKSRFNIWAMPVRPPETMLLGKVRKEKLKPTMMQPTMLMATALPSVLRN